MKWYLPKLTKRDFITIIILAIIYLFINVLNITSLPIFVDEAIYLRWSQIAWHDANWRFISLTDGKQPLYIWFVVPFMKIINDPLVAGRIASVIAGLFTVIGLFFAGALIKSKKVGYIALVLGLFSPFIYFYNRFAVMESMLTAFGVWIFILSFLQAKNLRLDLSLILGITGGLAMLVKSSALFYLLLIPVLLLPELKAKKNRKNKILKFLLFYGLTVIISFSIYNVQRLSPWMHVITDKNAFFTVPYGDIFKEPSRIINNFTDIFRWHFRYSTIPVVILGFYGLYKSSKDSILSFISYASWLIGPLLGTALIARLYAPRYIAFVTPFLILLAAYAFDSFKPKIRRIILIFTLLLPIYLITILNITPDKFPYVKVDEGYINGWSAGYGVKEISDFIVDRANNSDSKVYLYTEGTFGILPHGVELYIDGKTQNLEIIGVYPINPNEIPPYYVRDMAVTNETYFILNNTETSEDYKDLELVEKYDKAFDTSMRLYKVKN